MSTWRRSSWRRSLPERRSLPLRLSLRLPPFADRAIACLLSEARRDRVQVMDERVSRMIAQALVYGGKGFVAMEFVIVAIGTLCHIHMHQMRRLGPRVTTKP